MRTKQEPKCPNHGKYLEECGNPIPQKGTGICPVSGSIFEFELIQTPDGEFEWIITGGEIGDF